MIQHPLHWVRSPGTYVGSKSLPPLNSPLHFAFLSLSLSLIFPLFPSQRFNSAPSVFFKQTTFMKGIWGHGSLYRGFGLHWGSTLSSASSYQYQLLLCGEVILSRKQEAQLLSLKISSPLNSLPSLSRIMKLNAFRSAIRLAFYKCALIKHRHPCSLPLPPRLATGATGLFILCLLSVVLTTQWSLTPGWNHVHLASLLVLPVPLSLLGTTWLVLNREKWAGRVILSASKQKHLAASVRPSPVPLAGCAGCACVRLLQCGPRDHRD